MKPRDLNSLNQYTTMKKLIIRWALRQIKEIPQDSTYSVYGRFGIQDVITNSTTGEKMYIL